MLWISNLCKQFLCFFWETELREPTLVRKGEEVILPPSADGLPRHTALNVYTEMLCAVAQGYSGINAMELSMDDIEFFYDGLRPRLILESKNAKGSQS